MGKIIPSRSGPNDVLFLSPCDAPCTKHQAPIGAWPGLCPALKHGQKQQEKERHALRYYSTTLLLLLLYCFSTATFHIPHRYTTIRTQRVLPSKHTLRDHDRTLMAVAVVSGQFPLSLCLLPSVSTPTPPIARCCQHEPHRASLEHFPTIQPSIASSLPVPP